MTGENILSILERSHDDWRLTAQGLNDSQDGHALICVVSKSWVLRLSPRMDSPLWISTLSLGQDCATESLWGSSKITCISISVWMLSSLLVIGLVRHSKWQYFVHWWLNCSSSHRKATSNFVSIAPAIYCLMESGTSSLPILGYLIFPDCPVVVKGMSFRAL